MTCNIYLTVWRRIMVTYRSE